MVTWNLVRRYHVYYICFAAADMIWKKVIINILNRVSRDEEWVSFPEQEVSRDFYHQAAKFSKRRLPRRSLWLNGKINAIRFDIDVVSADTRENVSKKENKKNQHIFGRISWKPTPISNRIASNIRSITGFYGFTVVSDNLAIFMVKITRNRPFQGKKKRSSFRENLSLLFSRNAYTTTRTYLRGDAGQ